LHSRPTQAVVGSTTKVSGEASPKFDHPTRRTPLTDRHKAFKNGRKYIDASTLYSYYYND